MLQPSAAAAAAAVAAAGTAAAAAANASAADQTAAAAAAAARAANEAAAAALQVIAYRSYMASNVVANFLIYILKQISRVPEPPTLIHKSPFICLNPKP